MFKRLLTATLPIALLATAAATQNPIDRIREADLKRDLFALAGDAMRGREGGTLDEMTASAWVAERAREAGLLPAGDNGTYFQFFPLERLRVSASSTVTLNGKPLRMGRDVVPDNVVLADVDAPVTVAPGDSLEGLVLTDRVLVVRYAPAQPATGNALRTWLRGIQRVAAASAPAAIVAVVPDAAADQWERVALSFPRGTYGLDPEGTAEPRAAPRGMPMLYARESALGGAIAADARLVASISADSFTYPSVNVVAKAPGRDRRLAGQYVLFSAHQDHDGERYPVNGDNIWNGADDNATTAVALLAIGRAMSAKPARRSALFVWHGSEERGLMGSRRRATRRCIWPAGRRPASLPTFRPERTAHAITKEFRDGRPAGGSSLGQELLHRHLCRHALVRLDAEQPLCGGLVAPEPHRAVFRPGE